MFSSNDRINVSYTSTNSAQNSFDIEDYKRLNEAFLHDPSADNAKSLLEFLKQNKEAIEEFGIQYELFPGMTIDEYLNGAIGALDTGNPLIALQFCNNLACVLGIYGPPHQG